MKLYISINATLHNYTDVCNEVIAAFNSNGFETSMAPAIAEGYLPEERFTAADSDAIVAIGGDGTFLRACRTAISCGRPIFGVNAGRLGALCRYTCEEACTLTPEALVSCEPCPEPVFVVGGTSYLAVNDIIAAKDYFGSAVELEVSIDDHEPYSVRGDGVIIATPMGSTGYNISAGGPVLKDGGGIIVTPICAHNGVKPCIVDAGSTIRIRQACPKYTASVYGDGVRLCTLEDEISVRVSDRVLKRWKRN